MAFNTKRKGFKLLLEETKVPVDENYITCYKLYRHGDTKGICVTKEFASWFLNTNKSFQWRKLMTAQETREEDEKGILIPNDDCGYVAVEVNT